MSNVLPQEEKKALLVRFRARFIGVFAIVLFLSAAIASTSLIPAFISVRIARAALEAPQESQTASRDDQVKLLRAQTIVSVLTPIVAATSTPSEILAVAIGLKPGAVRVSGVTYTKGSLVLTGISSSRDAVNTYRQALEASHRFSAVLVPVAALVGAQEGRFTATLSGDF